MEEETGKPAASRRTVEIWTAVIVLLFGAIVVYDSQRLGARWGDDGPQPGYFPFYVGLLICISAIAVLVRALRERGASRAFVTRDQLKLILTVLVPTAVYAGAVGYLGLYVSSTIYIAFFMWWLGKYSWLKIVPVSVGVSVVIYLVFEIWFAVPLPKGPLESALGLG
ncbi:MAG TPA: tripartite tricarboxylate transporter TctB family protein [Burkholderiales bacterium]|nr:tripartite tricarboxylate transporter TctB family protein [Burkholderiales bacterium]